MALRAHCFLILHLTHKGKGGERADKGLILLKGGLEISCVGVVGQRPYLAKGGFENLAFLDYLR